MKFLLLGREKKYDCLRLPDPPKFWRQKKIFRVGKKFQLEKKSEKACFDRPVGPRIGRLKGDHSSSRCEFDLFPVSIEVAPTPP